MKPEDQIKSLQLLGMLNVLLTHVPADKLAALTGDALAAALPVVLKYVPEEQQGEMFGAIWEALAPVTEKYLT